MSVHQSDGAESRLRSEEIPGKRGKNRELLRFGGFPRKFVLNIYDFNSLPNEFPARLNRESIRDTRGSISR